MDALYIENKYVTKEFNGAKKAEWSYVNMPLSLRNEYVRHISNY